MIRHHQPTVRKGIQYEGPHQGLEYNTQDIQRLSRHPVKQLAANKPGLMPTHKLTGGRALSSFALNRPPPGASPQSLMCSAFWPAVEHHTEEAKDCLGLAGARGSLMIGVEMKTCL